MAGLELEERLEWVMEERRQNQAEARVARARLCELLVKQEREMAGDSNVVLVNTSDEGEGDSGRRVQNPFYDSD